ncbi:succinate dehydrogenase, hydrophobic membrane anchor protein [Psychrosphaera sp. B3R10]|uniref:Succinate dehydrogenase hydrophobic membrane anchor subunit n=1 Tax=Psychrosphaera algicola TaxID=3023714 RepID=A0ABT5FAW7_9GAMM|nr:MULTISPECIES: succinate dehydrogenase, hydrophobic membrane anchor protein [unclassified Psychrosphaera]MBU2882154.1 succinate dehydrogenase, hydrophobic membrane anchor protein [Psychrosphaera sp. I2R16]MBU2988835.1 succinate dehydrogenase, hydrophobic membrane anchor protein [Psychrosphaera sp. B3R10]MDC2887767.1 succinate dehydrogenase, hydrophobic membrane anchor protein [Psychrosphaera sp. G1-22]MDO6717855.1 succinate dehydrogenase, hydrophobic membrane anchor protein [Psychrosphaera sp
MLINQASLKRDGIQDYVSLRATALFMTAYVIFILGYFLTTPTVTYEGWSGLFSNIAVKVFTFITLLCIWVHTRIGLWQVLTDYVKSPKMRSILSFILNTIGLAYVITGLFVLWGV